MNSVYWAVPITGFQVGAGPYQSTPWVAIVDTGTTLLLVPDAMVNAYYALVPGARFDPSWGAILYPCTQTLPTFIFGIGSYRGTVPGHYVNYGNVNFTHCYGGIQSSEGIGISIIGDILIKAQFVVFDLGSRRVGFANKKLVPP